MFTQKVGDEIRYNYFGKTYTGKIKHMRPLTTNYNLTLVFTEQHLLTVDSQGNGTSYDGYSTAIVTCDDTPTTRAALEVLAAAFGGKDTDGFKRIQSAVAINS